MTHNDSAPCSGWEETSYLFLDGELNPPEREEFLVHLQQCATCQALLGEVQSLFTELAALTDVAAPATVAFQVMTNLPPLETSRRRAFIGWLVLAIQLGVGLALIILTLPLTASVFDERLLWLPWLALSETFISLGSWLTDLALNLSDWAQAQRLQGLGLLSFDLSQGVAIAIVAGLGLACLIGNTLLLGHNPHSLKNGGAS